MLVGERMSKPVITISPEMPIPDALNMMKKEHIRRAPVVKDGKLVGIVCDVDLLNASPSPVTTPQYLGNELPVEQNHRLRSDEQKRPDGHRRHPH